jgi:hypothetical protein
MTTRYQNTSRVFLLTSPRRSLIRSEAINSKRRELSFAPACTLANYTLWGYFKITVSRGDSPRHFPRIPSKSPAHRLSWRFCHCPDHSRAYPTRRTEETTARKADVVDGVCSQDENRCSSGDLMVRLRWTVSFLARYSERDQLRLDVVVRKSTSADSNIHRSLVDDSPLEMTVSSNDYARLIELWSAIAFSGELPARDPPIKMGQINCYGRVSQMFLTDESSLLDASASSSSVYKCMLARSLARFDTLFLAC